MVLVLLSSFRLDSQPCILNWYDFSAADFFFVSDSTIVTLVVFVTDVVELIIYLRMIILLIV